MEETQRTGAAKPSCWEGGHGHEKYGAVHEGAGFGAEEGDSKSAGEARLRKRATQSKSILEGIPRSNAEDAIEEKAVHGALVCYHVLG